MPREFKLKKRAIILILALLVAADAVLCVYAWNLGTEAHLQQELAQLAASYKLLNADIQRAQRIRQDIPATQKDCDRFEHALFPAASGYSAVTAELNSVAGKSGLQIEALTFRQSEVKGRDLAEVEMEATVNGSYSNVVRFLNGLQRSDNMYAVDALSLNSSAENQAARGLVKVSIHMKTYFRTV